MDLFAENSQSLSPFTVIDKYNSTVTYQSLFVGTDKSNSLFDYFFDNLNWKNDSAVIYGKTIITKRKIVWFSDKNLDYNYSGLSRVGDGKWDDEVLKIKHKIEVLTGFTFNSCLLNLYHTGQEGMGWHSDDQNHLDLDNTAVAIVSLGAERFLKIRETKDKKIQNKVLLEKGSLLLMLGDTQKHYQHEIPKMLKVGEPRISLTFRTMKKR